MKAGGVAEHPRCDEALRRPRLVPALRGGVGVTVPCGHPEYERSYAVSGPASAEAKRAAWGALTFVQRDLGMPELGLQWFAVDGVPPERWAGYCRDTDVIALNADLLAEMIPAVVAHEAAHAAWSRDYVEGKAAWLGDAEREARASAYERQAVRRMGGY